VAKKSRKHSVVRRKRTVRKTTRRKTSKRSSKRKVRRTRVKRSSSRKTSRRYKGGANVINALLPSFLRPKGQEQVSSIVHPSHKVIRNKPTKPTSTKVGQAPLTQTNRTSNAFN
jgi:hypothetical protein